MLHRVRLVRFIQSFDFPYRITPGLATELKKNVPDSEIIPIDPFKNEEGKNVKMKYNPNGLFINSSKIK
jgi:putative aldouronate transport system substrate-binding protein